MNRKLPRHLSALLLTLVLSTPAWAAGGWEARTDSAPGFFFAAVWQFLESLAADTDGCAGLDPNGAAAPSTDNDGRATLDPNG